MGAPELLDLASELLDPKSGVLRGIYSSDGPNKLLRMNVGEARRIARFIEGAKPIIEAAMPEPQAEAA